MNLIYLLKAINNKKFPEDTPINIELLKMFIQDAIELEDEDIEDAKYGPDTYTEDY